MKRNIAFLLCLFIGMGLLQGQNLEKIHDFLSWKARKQNLRPQIDPPQSQLLSVQEYVYSAELKGAEIVPGELRMELEFDFDDQGRQILDRKADGSSQIVYRYDDDGKLLERSRQFGDDPPLGGIRFAYDENGRKISSEMYARNMDLDEGPILFKWDGDRLSSIVLTNPDGSIWQTRNMEHMPGGDHYTIRETWNSDGIDLKRIEYIFDAQAGHLLEAIEWDTYSRTAVAHQAYTYDAAGRMTGEADWRKFKAGFDIMKNGPENIAEAPKYAEYRYEGLDDHGNWTRKIILRNGEPNLWIERAYTYR